MSYDLFKMLAAGAQQEEVELPSEAEQIKRLNIFGKRKVDYKVGDRLVRNEDGEKRYRIPKKDQVALVVSVYKEPRIDSQGDIVHGEIAVMSRHAKDCVIAHSVDFRYYKTRPTLA